MVCHFLLKASITCISDLSLLPADSCQGWDSLTGEGPFTNVYERAK